VRLWFDQMQEFRQTEAVKRIVEELGILDDWHATGTYGNLCTVYEDGDPDYGGPRRKEEQLSGRLLTIRPEKPPACAEGIVSVREKGTYRLTVMLACRSVGRMTSMTGGAATSLTHMLSPSLK
jgi:hypothetical protein